MVLAASPDRLRIAVLISGGGRTLLNLIERIECRQLSAEICLVVSSSPRAGGLKYAQQAKIPTLVRTRSQATSPEAFSESIFAACRRADAELVVMGGFLKHVLIPADFEGRVMNIHPSLIPAFCGAGLYGQHVHRAVLDYGVKLSGCTVHFVDNHYDQGPIIAQRVVPVEDHDTVESLAARVFAEECEAYPQAIQWFAEGRLSIVGRQVRVDSRARRAEETSRPEP
jgi:phosphoribosylglycinamide formyltransferase-1